MQSAKVDGDRRHFRFVILHKIVLVQLVVRFVSTFRLQIAAEEALRGSTCEYTAQLLLHPRRIFPLTLLELFETVHEHDSVDLVQL